MAIGYLDLKKLLTKILVTIKPINTWYTTGLTSNIVSYGTAPSTSSSGVIIRLRGNGVSGTTATSDTYWLGVDSGGKLFTGVQLNGASTITWREK